MAILRLIPSDGIDEIDGSEQNAVRRTAFALLDRTLDDLTDLEIFSRQTDEAVFLDFCLDELRRLPSEVEPLIGMREWTMIQARGIVKQAQAQLMRQWADVARGSAK